MFCSTVLAHGKQCIAVWDALIELFEAPVIESNSVGRSVLASIFGDQDIPFDKPVIDIASPSCPPDQSRCTSHRVGD